MSKKNVHFELNPRGFPYREVTILVLCVSVSSYTRVNLFPYVGIMVMQLMRLDSINDSGFYAGYVASAFMFGRFVSGYALGYVSDRVGRKPVIVVGLFFMIILSLVFGFSESFAWAIGSRLLLGLTNGIVGAARTSTREVCGREHVVMGMIYVGGAKAMGLVMGAGIGGLLATPATLYPGTFSRAGLFGRYPFLLPNIFGAVLAALCLLLVLFWLPETKGLDELKGDRELTRLGTESAADNNTRVTEGGSFGSNGEGEMSPLAGDIEEDGDIEEETNAFCGRGGVIQDCLVLKILFLGCIMQIILMGFDEVFSLWMLSTPGVGGLNWSNKEIGEILLATGIIMGVLQLALLPRIIKFIGIVRWQRAGWVIGVITFMLIPNAKGLSWNSPSLFTVVAAGGLFVNCSITAVLIALNVASTNIVQSHHRGKLSGLYNTAESLGRFIGPVAYSTTYALSISRSTSNYSWMDHHFVFYVSAVTMALMAWLGWRTLTSEILVERAEAEEVR